MTYILSKWGEKGEHELKRLVTVLKRGVNNEEPICMLEKSIQYTVAPEDSIGSEAEKAALKNLIPNYKGRKEHALNKRRSEELGSV